MLPLYTYAWRLVWLMSVLLVPESWSFTNVASLTWLPERVSLLLTLVLLPSKWFMVMVSSVSVWLPPMSSAVFPWFSVALNL